MLISWINAAPAAKRAKLEDFDSAAKRSLTFLSSQAGDPSVRE